VPVAQWVTPRLTTVHQQIRAKGKLAAELLVKLLEGGSVENSHVLPAFLVERESVGTPPRA
jgi:DNA-binding LacI/PurR family transcriptional regulator